MKRSNASQKKNKLELWWPRPYISWSQYNKWRTSERQYLAHYCPEQCGWCGSALWREDWTAGRCHECWEPVISEWTNPAMQLGSQVALMLERNHIPHDDPMLEFYRQKLPKYPHHEYQIVIDFAGMKFSGKLDGWDPKTRTIGEYKTGRDWSQARADLHEQLDFYQLLVWKHTGRLAKRILLHWIPTRFNFSTMKPELTGDVVTFETQRTKEQMLKIAADAKKAYLEIGAACAAIPNPFVIHRKFPS